MSEMYGQAGGINCEQEGYTRAPWMVCTRTATQPTLQG